MSFQHFAFLLFCFSFGACLGQLHFLILLFLPFSLEEGDLTVRITAKKYGLRGLVSEAKVGLLIGLVHRFENLSASLLLQLVIH